jgi:hypothetical protein
MGHPVILCLSMWNVVPTSGAMKLRQIWGTRTRDSEVGAGR